MEVGVEVNRKYLAQWIQELSWVYHYISMQRRIPIAELRF